MPVEKIKLLSLYCVWRVMAGGSGIKAERGQPSPASSTGQLNNTGTSSYTGIVMSLKLDRSTLSKNWDGIETI